MKTGTLVAVSSLLLVQFAVAGEIPRVGQVYHFSDRISSVSFIGNHAYIPADGSLNLFEVVEPGNLRHLWRTPEIDNFRVRNDSVAYSLFGTRIQIYDITELDNPQVISGLGGGLEVLEYFQWSDNLFYYWAYTDDLFDPYPLTSYVIFDMTDVRNPRSLRNPDDIRGKYFARYDTLVYCQNWDGDFVILSISDTLSIHLVEVIDGLRWIPIVSFEDEALLFFSLQTQDEPKYYALADLSNPIEPELIFRYEDYPDPKGVVIRDSLMFIRLNDETRLDILNIADLLQSELLASITANRGFGQISFWRDQLVLLDEENIIEFVDLTDLENPEIVEWSNHGAVTLVETNTRNTFVYTGYNMLRVLDITSPARPREIGSLELPRDPTELYLQNDRLFAALDGGGICVLDISEPANPQEITTILPDKRAKNISVLDEMLYMADYRFELFDISDLENPDSLTILSNISSYYVLGDILFAGEEGYVRVYVMDDPEHPHFVRRFTLPHRGGLARMNMSIAASDRYIYNTYGRRELDRFNETIAYVDFNVIDPRLPDTSAVMKNVYLFESWNVGIPYMPIVEFVDNTAFILARDNVLAYRWNEQERDLDRWRFDYNGRVYDLSISGRYAYAAEYNSLGIYNCSAALSIPPESEFILPPSSPSLAAYPNPFNSQVNLALNLPYPQLGNLQIMDACGRKVAELPCELTGAGRQVIPWNAAGMPAGNYYVRWEGANGVILGSVALIK